MILLDWLILPVSQRHKLGHT